MYEDECRIPAKLLRNVHILDELYPKIKIDLVLVPGTFSPDIIDYLSQQLEIPKVRDFCMHSRTAPGKPASADERACIRRSPVFCFFFPLPTFVALIRMSFAAAFQNLMFITCPTADFAHKIETLGGVRLITH